MTGPHLSGLEFFGHIVTVGNITFLIGTTTVFEAIGCVDHAAKRNTDVCKYSHNLGCGVSTLGTLKSGVEACATIQQSMTCYLF